MPASAIRPICAPTTTAIRPTTSAKSMFGYSGEIAYHIPLGTILNSDWEAVPFYNYTYENFQTGGFAGTDTNLPTGAGQRQFQTAALRSSHRPKWC